MISKFVSYGFFSLFNAKTGYGRLDTAKSLDTLIHFGESKTLKCVGVGVYSAEAGVESESKISDSVHLWSMVLTGTSSWSLTNCITVQKVVSTLMELTHNCSALGLADNGVCCHHPSSYSIQGRN